MAASPLTVFAPKTPFANYTAVACCFLCVTIRVEKASMRNGDRVTQPKFKVFSGNFIFRFDGGELHRDLPQNGVNDADVV